MEEVIFSIIIVIFYFYCVLFFLAKFPSGLDFAPHSGKELSLVVPLVLLVLLVVVVLAAAVFSTGAPPT